MNATVIAAYVIAIIIEIVGPIAAGFWTENRLDVPWRLFAYGALVYGVMQLLLRIPLINLLANNLKITEESSFWTILAWTAFLAATAALVENVGRYLGYRFLFRDIEVDWSSSVMYGLGHGGLESIIIVGLPTLLTLMNIVSIPGMDAQALNMTAEQAQQLALAKEQIKTLQPWMPLLGALERVLTIGMHVGLSVLVAQVFIRRSWRWLGYAFGLHFLADWAAPLAAQYVHVLLAEAIVTLAAAISLYWAWKLRPAPDKAKARS